MSMHMPIRYVYSIVLWSTHVFTASIYLQHTGIQHTFTHTGSCTYLCFIFRHCWDTAAGACTHAYASVHTHMHTYMHAHLHIHMHACMQMCAYMSDPHGYIERKRGGERERESERGRERGRERERASEPEESLYSTFCVRLPTCSFSYEYIQA